MKEQIQHLIQEIMTEYKNLCHYFEINYSGFQTTEHNYKFVYIHINHYKIQFKYDENDTEMDTNIIEIQIMLNTQYFPLEGKSMMDIILLLDIVGQHNVDYENIENMEFDNKEIQKYFDNMITIYTNLIVNTNNVEHTDEEKKNNICKIYWRDFPALLHNICQEIISFENLFPALKNGLNA